MTAFFKILNQEWHSIDRLRLDKFYLVRLCTHCSPTRLYCVHSLFTYKVVLCALTVHPQGCTVCTHCSPTRLYCVHSLFTYKVVLCALPLLLVVNTQSCESQFPVAESQPVERRVSPVLLDYGSFTSVVVSLCGWGRCSLSMHMVHIFFSAG